MFKFITLQTDLKETLSFNVKWLEIHLQIV